MSSYVIKTVFYVIKTVRENSQFLASLPRQFLDFTRKLY